MLMTELGPKKGHLGTDWGPLRTQPPNPAPSPGPGAPA